MSSRREPRLVRATLAALVGLSLVLSAAATCARGPIPPAPTAAAPAPVPAAPPRPARPIVVLHRHAVLSGEGAAHLPLFVLYDDGRVIVPRRVVDGVPRGYETAWVDARDPVAALARLGIGPEFFRLRPSYDVRPDRPDHDAVFLSVWRGDSLTRVVVRDGFAGRNRLSSQAPAAFREAWRGLTTFRPAGAVEWHPDTIEVAAWPYEYAPDDPPLRWPTGWPGLASPGSALREGRLVDTVWTIPLGAERLPELKRLLRRRRTKQAILVDGRKVAMSWRLTFPGEARWRGHFAELEM